MGHRNVVHLLHENINLKIDVDVGMKKAQKQEIIQDARRFEVLYPFLHYTLAHVVTCMYIKLKVN